MRGRRSPIKRRGIFLITVITVLSVISANKIFVPERPKTGLPGQGWSIGIYGGNSPYHLAPLKGIKNPALTAADVDDVPAKFVADPFMVRDASGWHMFFEVLNARTHQGDIGSASSSDGLIWTYKQIVLDEPFHLSYPYVFKWNNEYYMIPESCAVNSVRLYKAIDFPVKWIFIGNILKGKRYVDTSIFRFNDQWWLFTTGGAGEDTLYLYYARELTGPWREHPKSPVVNKDRHTGRSGGRVLVFNDRVIRYAQDDKPVYGGKIRAFEVTRISAADYEEKETDLKLALKAAGTGWNVKRTHNIDPHEIEENKWLACVDGRK